jgi:hypothetical protein
MGEFYDYPGSNSEAQENNKAVVVGFEEGQLSQMII